MKWKKLGRIFVPDARFFWMKSHASLPIPEFMEKDVYKIYFSSRTSENISYTGYIIIDIKAPDKILEISKSPVLSPGTPGAFDDSGAMASCLVQHGQKKYMYYIGWNLSVTVPFRNSIGLAIANKPDEKFVKAYEGPVLDRNIYDPYFVASTHIIKEDNRFRMWYLSCRGWTKDEKNNMIHHYNIKYTDSEDGINWRMDNKTSIDFKNKYEYAISTPRVIKDANIYKMWYSYRAGPKNQSYRIGYAESPNGIGWTRKDEQAGIDVSENGWDSEMICYPHIFDHKGKRYMLYNGNGYGKTGFGLAVLVQSKPE